jgi:cytoskeletal protein CcmA (bactofilin family)
MSLFNRSEKASEAKPADAKPRDTMAQPQSPTAPSDAAKKFESTAPTPVEPPRPAPSAKPAPTPTPPQPKTGVTMASVISKALKITGELESTEDIQIDGQIEGDVRGVGVKIGQSAKVKGTVYGDEVELAGTVEGRIESKRVILASTARMTGDVWHQEIKIESGAYINGNLKPDLGKAEARPVPKPVAATGGGISPVSSATAAAQH